MGGDQMTIEVGIEWSSGYDHLILVNVKEWPRRIITTFGASVPEALAKVAENPEWILTKENPYPGHVPKETNMSKNTEQTSERFARAHALQKEGYYIGPRDPKRNTVFKGAWMVCANPDFDNATLDGSVGGYCIVGDDLDDLIDTAFNNLLD